MYISLSLYIYIYIYTDGIGPPRPQLQKFSESVSLIYTLASLASLLNWSSGAPVVVGGFDSIDKDKY